MTRAPIAETEIRWTLGPKSWPVAVPLTLARDAQAVVEDPTAAIDAIEVLGTAHVDTTECMHAIQSAYSVAVEKLAHNEREIRRLRRRVAELCEALRAAHRGGAR